ncbi:hypothetical protein GOP47_0021218 [Adiantum capillus-veneris]|uniref:Uncharacterized protein n=1 Tax=Adiantum capillus-veneris TaxID=13818 RepID=A0A9D4UBN5_ADICA|nr:hypothetical protein GOP47_0021218 [Adiantum capillus-veneris]
MATDVKPEHIGSLWQQHRRGREKLPGWLFRLPLMELALASTGLQPGDCVRQGMLPLLNQTLNSLVLAGNNLTGPDILNCFALYNFSIPTLDLSSNPLAFELSTSQLPPYTQFLDLSHCLLHGPIPTKFPISLEELYLTNNTLSGCIRSFLQGLDRFLGSIFGL